VSWQEDGAVRDVLQTVDSQPAGELIVLKAYALTHQLAPLEIDAVALDDSGCITTA
jgi:hypothetical protein